MIKRSAYWTLTLLIITLFSCSRFNTSYFLKKTTVTTFNKETDCGNCCNDLLNYAPDERYPEHTIMRYVRVNIHAMHSTKRGRNFSKEELIDYGHRLIELLNWRNNHNRKMNLPLGNETPVLPMKYNFILSPDTSVPGDDGFYLHYDDTLAFAIKKGKDRNKFDRDIFDKYGVRQGEVLNIFLQEHHPDSMLSKNYGGGISGVGFNQFVKIFGSYWFLYDTTYAGDTFTVKTNCHFNLTNHEIGHTMGLAHTWSFNDGCDDTPHHPNCYGEDTPPCNENGQFSNNIMDYNYHMCALSPCQIAKVHYNFYKPYSTQRKLLLPNWCKYKKDSSITIPPYHVVNWYSKKEFEGDIILEKGAKLTIYCEVALPKGGRVVVSPQAELVLAGGKITNNCGDKWEGIEILNGKKGEGEVKITGNSSLENVVHEVKVVNDNQEADLQL